LLLSRVGTLHSFSDRRGDLQYSRFMRYRILAFLWFIAMVAYIQRAAISVPLPEIGKDLGLTDPIRELGIMQSAWFLSYALLQLPGGWLADRIGGRRGIMLFAVLAALGTGLAGASRGYGELFATWTVMGAFQAGLFPCAVKSIGRVFSEHERARASGLLGCGMMAGGAIAPVLTAWLLGVLTETADRLAIDRWRLCLMLYAVPGILWAIAFRFGSLPAGLDAPPTAATRAKPIAWGRVLANWSLRLLCLQQFLRAAGMVFFLTWFPTFLRETRDVSMLESGLLTTYAGAAGMLGSVSGGFFSDWLLKRTGHKRLSRQGIAVLGMASCAILITASYFIADVHEAIALISLGAFCATFGGVSGYTVAIDFGGRHVATVFGAMNSCGAMGSMLFPVTIGWLVSATGNWNVALFAFAGLMAVDAVCWALLNPRGTLFGEEAQNETT
jgi:MFS family permease